MFYWGPIDNSTLIDSDGNLLPEKADDFVPVNEHVWKYLINVHGGGPVPNITLYTNLRVIIVRNLIPFHTKQLDIKIGAFWAKMINT